MPGCICGGQGKPQMWVFISIVFEMGVSNLLLHSLSQLPYKVPGVLLSHCKSAEITNVDAVVKFYDKNQLEGGSIEMTLQLRALFLFQGTQVQATAST